MSEKSKPVFTSKKGMIDVAVWENPGKDGKDNFLTVTFSRSYKDNNDNWKTTTSMRVNDLPVLTLALGEAFNWAKSPKDE